MGALLSSQNLAAATPIGARALPQKKESVRDLQFPLSCDYPGRSLKSFEPFFISFYIPFPFYFFASPTQTLNRSHTFPKYWAEGAKLGITDNLFLN
jgi:hypothetical protein